MDEFSIGPRLREAARIVNTLDSEKFSLFAGRIIAKLCVKGAQLFTNAEEIQLRSMFELSVDQLNLVLEGISYIFEQAAFAGLTPDPLNEVLTEAGFDESHAKVVTKVWTTNASEYVSKLRSQTLGAAKVLKSECRLNLVMAQKGLILQQEPRGIVELSLSDPTKEGDAPIAEKLSLDFSHDELFSFFNKLDRIQQQLDSLST